MKELKEKGYGIYLCSNCSVRLRVFEHEIPGIEYFDGHACLSGGEAGEAESGDL